MKGEGSFGGGVSPELHLRLVGAFIGELHGNVLQLGLAQAQSGGVLVHHGPVAIHHRAGFCQVGGRAHAVLLHWTGERKTSKEGEMETLMGRNSSSRITFIGEQRQESVVRLW